MPDPDTSPAGSQAPAPKPDPNERKIEANRFGLHPLVIALVGLYFFLIIGGTVFVALWRDKMDMLDGLFFSVLISAFIIGVPSWLVWRISRSRLAGNIVCTLMVGLMISFFFVGIFTGITSARNNDAALAKFDKNLEAQKANQSDLLDRAIAGEDVTDESLDQFDQSMQNLEQLSNESRGQQARVFTILSEVMKRLEQPFLSYSDSVNQLFDAGSIDPATLGSPEAIVERLRMVEDFAAANERLAIVYASLEADLRTKLRADKLDDDMIDFIVRNWKQGARPDLIAKIRQTDRDLAVSLRGILNTLAEAEGQWSLGGELVVIEDDTLREQYTTHYDRMIEASELQEDLQRQVQEAVKSQQATTP